MSDKLSLCTTKMSLCPTNCPYVQQKCSQSKTGGRRPLQPASYYKDEKVYLSKIIRKLYSKHVNIVTSNIQIWQWSWTIIEITSFFKFHWVYASIQIALTFVLVYLPFFVSIFFFVSLSNLSVLLENSSHFLCQNTICPLWFEIRCDKMFLYLIVKLKNLLLNSTLENCLSIFCKNVKKKWYV